MAYEYEYEGKNMMAGVYSSLATNESVKELEEVYAKAKAWQKLKEDYIRNYIQACKEDRFLVQQQHYAAVVYAMDCYDGKTELQDLLEDMERE